MKNKIKVISAYIMICVIGLSSVLYAKTTSTYNYEYYTKYKIVLDGEQVTIPDTVTYSDDYNLDLSNYHNRLASLNGDLIKYSSDKKLAFGGIFSSITSDEYKALVELKGNIKNPIDNELLNKYDLVKYFLPTKEKNLVKYQNERNASGTTSDRIKILDVIIANYQQDIEELKVLKQEVDQLTSTHRTLLGVPYLVKRVTTTQQVNVSAQTLKETNTIRYYLYTAIYRDLTLRELNYSINSGAVTPVANFDKDTYTYNISLPANTPRNATINTSSTSSMVYSIENSTYKGTDLGIMVEDTQIELINGKGTAKVVVTFDISDYRNNDDYTSNITREYTVNFTVSDYAKGDINKDGLVDSADAAIALNLFKYNNATQDNINFGDMDGNGLIDSADAAIILNVYKYSI